MDINYKPKVRIKSSRTLSDNWRPLNEYIIEYTGKDNKTVELVREVYNRGNGAAILLYDLDTQHLILTRQFRLPCLVNGHRNGMIIEVCAGLLDGDSAEEGIRREALEETGYELSTIEKVAELYMTPGADTELLHLFMAPYSKAQKITEGGGLDSENEDIEVLEIPFQEAFSLMDSGKIIDAKTYILLQRLKLTLLENRK